MASLPIVAIHGFEVAFPSIGHCFLFMALESFGVPGQMLALVAHGRVLDETCARYNAETVFEFSSLEPQSVYLKV